jgi:hypothetical protein
MASFQWQERYSRHHAGENITKLLKSLFKSYFYSKQTQIFKIKKLELLLDDLETNMYFDRISTTALFVKHTASSLKDA